MTQTMQRTILWRAREVQHAARRNGIRCGASPQQGPKHPPRANTKASPNPLQCRTEHARVSAMPMRVRAEVSTPATTSAQARMWPWQAAALRGAVASCAAGTRSSERRAATPRRGRLRCAGARCPAPASPSPAAVSVRPCAARVFVCVRARAAPGGAAAAHVLATATSRARQCTAARAGSGFRGHKNALLGQ